MAEVLITGANRGIGLALVRHYARAGWRVHAACRDPSSATALNAVEGNVAVHGLDVADPAAARGLAAALADRPIVWT